MSTTPAETPPPSPRRRPWLVPVVVLLVAGIGVGGYFAWKKFGQREAPLPAPGDPVYEECAEVFGVGVAALDVGLGAEAEKNLTRATELVPGEPAGWANRGLLYLRTRQEAKAAADFARAEQLAPDNPDIQKFLGLLELQKGRYPEAIARFRRAAEKDPNDPELLFSLARAIDKEQKPDADAEYQKLMERVLALRPENLLVLTEHLRVAVRRGDKAAINATLDRLRKLSPRWSEQARKLFAEVEMALTDPGGAVGPLLVLFIPTHIGPLSAVPVARVIREPNAAVGPLLGFSNVLKGEPGYPRDAAEVNPQDADVGNPLRNFVKLAPLRNAPATPDTDLTFTPVPFPDAPPGKWDAISPAWLTAEGAPAVFVANGQELRRIGPGAPLPSIRVAPGGLVPLDWNNDFRTDLLLTGPGGVRFYQQGADGNFADVTAKTKLPDDVVKGDYAAALAADTDLDGDLDILLARRTGPLLLLRNNLDGTFTPQPVFPGVDGARAFAWADLDHDGAPDAAILDAKGKLHVFANERSGRFVPWPVAVPDGRFLAFAVTDADDDGVLDLVALRDDGALIRIRGRDKRAAWDVAELGRWQPPPGAEPGSITLLTGDFDNNGVPDILVSGTSGGMAWLGSGNGKFATLTAAVPARVFAAADTGNTGRLDLLGLDADGRPTRFRTTGKKNYHWTTVRFRAQPQDHVTGDNRINSFGVGGEVEVRTGTHVVKRPLAAPAVHVGLGDRTRADVVRIQWPNGQFQVEFRPDIDRVFSPEQRLKGSCPFLFTWNGERFVFVTDFMWSTPLGLYINAQARGGFLQSREWVRVRGDQLVPKDGFYEARAQANLWESHFFDHLALHVIDHPADTELFVDERFALEPTPPAFQITGPTRPVARARDHFGGDATDIVRAADGVYLDRCGRGLYQGVTNDHWVEVELGDDAPKDGPVWLVALGWIHPTDSSVNFALEQGGNTKPRGLVLEVPDGKGGWKVARDGIGFPAGKNKTVLLRLDGLDGPGVCRHFRLRTNMEIFWDSLHYARGRSDAEVRKTELLPAVADLRFRGILEMTQANLSSPELPDYDRIATRSQAWRDLIGYHTRFGDVRELLEKVDDRYAILNAGDEIALKFPVPPGPPPGWKRDFVWVSDGWEKDGDFNTRFGKTVLPLPYHGMPSYDTPPGRLEDDPVFRRHRKDWETYHTRYVTPAGFERGLRPRSKP